MNILAFIKALLDAVAAIPVICKYAEQIAAAAATWYIQRQDKSTLQDIRDAAALAINAKTTEDRFKAAEKWQEALGNKRYSK